MASAPDLLDAILVSPAAWVRESYRSRLELDGYRVRVTADAVDAFREIRRAAPDLVFVDRDSDRDLVEILTHLLGRAEVDRAFPILCIERRRQAAGGGLDQPALTYVELDGWWQAAAPVAAPSLHVLGAQEAG